MRASSRLLCGCLLVLLAGWPLPAAGSRLVAVIPRDSPPTYFEDAKTGKATGFAVEVMDLVARRAGYEVEYRFAQDWAVMVDLVARGEADVIPGMGISPARLARLDFTAPVDVFPVVFFVLKESDWTPDQPVQRHVGAVRGSVAYEHLKSWSHLVLHDYSTFTDGLFDLLAGNIDAFACPQPTLLKLARESGVEERIRVVGEPITEIKRSIAVRKGNAPLLASLDAAIAGLTADPEYQRIYAKWYTTPPPFWTGERIALFAGSGLLFAIAAMALWHYWSLLRLNRQLAETVVRRREAEQSLRLFRELVDESSDALFVIEPATGRILDANSRAWNSLGYSREELLTKRVKDIETTLPDDGSWQQHVAGVQKAGGILLEGEHRRRDGTVFPVEITVRHVGHGDEEYLVAIARDITERRQAEAERARLLGEVKTLSGLLPICSACKKIRDDQGYWTQVETYLHRHSAAEFTHSLCPDCVKTLYPELAGQLGGDRQK